jgi:PST family polysaccharide transporter
VDQERIGHRARRGISWNLAGAVATNGMRIVVIAVLGRALTSKDFGIVAAAISINVFLYSIRDVGVGLALVQRKELDSGHVSTAFAVSVYLGLAISGGLALLAPVVGDLYRIPESIGVIRVLGLLFALRGVSATSRMLCQRRMNFRGIAITDALSFVVGSLTSILLAVAGFGPWSLVAGYLVEEGLATVIYLSLAPPRVSMRVDRGRFRDLMSFGGGQTVGQIAGVLAIYGDNFVVGHTLGANALGYYTRAYDLIKFPSMVFSNIVGNVLFPAFAKFQDQRPRLAANFRRVIFVNALLLLPASAALIVLAPEVIRVMMGPGWGAAVLPFQILCLTMLMRTNQKLGAIVASAANAVNAIAVAYIIYAAAVIGGALLSIRWGIAGVATTTGVAILISNVECFYIAMRVSGLSLADVLRAHVPGLTIALVVAAVGWPLAGVLRAASFSYVLVLASVGCMAVAVSLAFVGMWLVRSRGDFMWLRQELARFRGRRAA